MLWPIAASEGRLSTLKSQIIEASCRRFGKNEDADGNPWRASDSRSRQTTSPGPKSSDPLALKS